MRRLVDRSGEVVEMVVDGMARCVRAVDDGVARFAAMPHERRQRVAVAGLVVFVAMHSRRRPVRGRRSTAIDHGPVDVPA